MLTRKILSNHVNHIISTSRKCKMSTVAINMKKEVKTADLEGCIGKLTEALKTEGFGILTRIDLHLKVKEKLGKDLRPVVILGACNPALAYEAYSQNPDVSSLLPCNVCVRDIGEGKLSVEIVKPSAMMLILGDRELVELSKDADEKLERALSKI